MKRTIEITEQEIKDLKLIRNYFGEHDKTPLEHLAYSELDKLVKKLQQADVVGRSEQLKCGNSNPPCSPNIKFGCLECTECNWSEY